MGRANEKNVLQENIRWDHGEEAPNHNIRWDHGEELNKFHGTQGLLIANALNKGNKRMLPTKEHVLRKHNTHLVFSKGFQVGDEDHNEGIRTPTSNLLLCRDTIFKWNPKGETMQER
jgi:hypothetical protein